MEGTIRRFLEHWGQGIESIVFCLNDLMEYNLYHKILPLYFPRNLREEIYSKQELPRDIGNEFGETVIEERKIKISAFPGLAGLTRFWNLLMRSWTISTPSVCVHSPSYPT